MAGDGKFWIQKVEELYYPCRENKGSDQLRGYRKADLGLCFHLCRLLVFPRGGSISDSVCRGYNGIHLSGHYNRKPVFAIFDKVRYQMGYAVTE